MKLNLVKELTPQKFNSETQAWVDSENLDGVHKNELTLVTYNVWFSEYFRQERCEALLEIIRGCNADVIGLQEVTPSFLETLLRQDWVRESYYISDSQGVTVTPHGVLLLSRLPIQKLYFRELFSFKNRQLLFAELLINGETFYAATVHLESQKQSTSIREQQLAEIFPLLSNSQHCVLMGDFNLCASWKENKNLDNSYQDLWAILNPNEPGYTENTDINIMRLQAKGKKRKVRFDRILLRSASQQWQPQFIQLIGTEAISSDYPNVFPSDHFGLIAKIA